MRQQMEPDRVIEIVQADGVAPCSGERFSCGAPSPDAHIILSNPVSDINKASSAFRQELDYLVEQGFRLSNDGTRMIR